MRLDGVGHTGLRDLEYLDSRLLDSEGTPGSGVTGLRGVRDLEYLSRLDGVLLTELDGAGLTSLELVAAGVGTAAVDSSLGFRT